MKKELYINESPTIDFFLHHAFPVAMIEGKYNNFLYSNYIQLCKNNKNKYLFDIYPRFGTGATFGDNIFDNLFENYILSGDFISLNYSEFKNLVCKEIDRGFYFQTLSNEAIIPDTSFYKYGEFFCHQAFYYGYDLNKNVLLMLNFDSNGKMKKIEVDFRIVYNSIFSDDMRKYLNSDSRVRKFDRFMLEFRKLKEGLMEYNFSVEKSIERIGKNLKDYIQGINSSSNDYLQYERTSDNLWGIKVYKIFNDFFEGKYSSQFGIQGVCGLYEHKVLMQKRLEFLEEVGIEIKESDKCLVKEIVKIGGIIKNTYIWCDIKGDRSRLNKCVKKLNLIETLERELIENIVNSINKGF